MCENPDPDSEAGSEDDDGHVDVDDDVAVMM